MIDPDSIRADHAPGIRSIVGPRLQALADEKKLRLSVRSNHATDGSFPLSKPLSAEEAEAETRHRFAVRANSILAFIECDDELRPKLREAIVEAMLWAQAQPKLSE
jgi:cation transport ATPase